jgi:hypothetical protein
MVPPSRRIHDHSLPQRCADAASTCRNREISRRPHSGRTGSAAATVSRTTGPPHRACWPPITRRGCCRRYRARPCRPAPMRRRRSTWWRLRRSRRQPVLPLAQPRRPRGTDDRRGADPGIGNRRGDERPAASRGVSRDSRPASQHRRVCAGKQPGDLLLALAEREPEVRSSSFFHLGCLQPATVPCRRSLRRSNMASTRSNLRSRWTS